MTMGIDRTYHVHHFIFSFTFYFFVYFMWYRLSWLPVSFLLHVKYTLSYRIVSYYITDVTLIPYVTVGICTIHRTQRTNRTDFNQSNSLQKQIPCHARLIINHNNIRYNWDYLTISNSPLR